MDNRPIGVFDSGLGGLTTVRRLREVMPGEEIIYLGDTGRVPYGGRSHETIVKYAREDIRFLLGFDIKALVVACGTVSTVALDEIAGDYALPIYGVVKPASRLAALHSAGGRIGLIATKASVSSGAYQAEIRRRRPDAQVFAQACPLFVPLVEAGHFRADDPLVQLTVAEYLEGLRGQAVDTLILGCTHYPLLSDAIGQYMGPEVRLIDSGAATAEFIAAELLRTGACTGRRSIGSCRFFVTDSVDGFSESASIFLQHDIFEEVTKVELA